MSQKNQKRLWIIHGAIFLFALVFFVIGIDRVDYQIFDEIRYAPDGGQFTVHGMNWNWTSPPLGRMLIGLGISIFGYEPLGWRIMSAIFGALSLNAMFSLGLIFFKTELLALEVVALCFLNQMLFVQSRIAMLDIFMFTFMAWGFVFFFRKWKNPVQGTFMLAGVFFGLAIAVKWFAIIPAAFCNYLYLTQNVKHWKIPKNMKWFWKLPQQLKKGINRENLKWFWWAPPLATYFVVYLPLIGMGHPNYATQLASSSPTSNGSTYGLWDLIPLQWEMFKTQVAYGRPDHPFESAWYTWPFWYNQFWYRSEVKAIDGNNFFEGILFFGNPLILWLGVLAVGVTIYAWIKKKNETAKIISLLYLVLFLSWTIIPRKTTYLFYYFPAAMFLSFNIVFAAQYFKVPLRHRAGYLFACALVFMYFYPLLSFIQVPFHGGPYEWLFKLWNVQALD
jgi:dolichyl-phosphate-mannose-protein mannosyltransferase